MGPLLTPVAAEKSAEVRFLQGLALGLGAAALEVLVEHGTVRFFWTPLIIGLAYLAAATAGGRTGGHWPTACVLVGWGAVVVWAGVTRPHDIDLEGLYLAGGGAGALAAGVLLRLGVAVDPIGVGATAVGAGAVLALSPRYDVLLRAQTFAIALAVVAAVNLLLALRAYRRPA